MALAQTAKWNLLHRERARGSTLPFETTLPKAGNWRLFLQFQTGGSLHTAEVTPPSDNPARPGPPHQAQVQDPPSPGRGARQQVPTS
ncbi:MAG: hypothetical protein ACRDS0_36525 [Pseudonocardiaceae bacterium]